MTIRKRRTRLLADILSQQGTTMARQPMGQMVGTGGSSVPKWGSAPETYVPDYSAAIAPLFQVAGAYYGDQAAEEEQQAIQDWADQAPKDYVDQNQPDVTGLPQPGTNVPQVRTPRSIPKSERLAHILRGATTLPTEMADPLMKGYVKSYTDELEPDSTKLQAVWTNMGNGIMMNKFTGDTQTVQEYAKQLQTAQKIKTQSQLDTKYYGGQVNSALDMLRKGTIDKAQFDELVSGNLVEDTQMDPSATQTPAPNGQAGQGVPPSNTATGNDIAAPSQQRPTSAMSGALRNKTPVETAVEIAAQKALPAQKTKEAQAQLNKETMTGAISNFLNAANEAESVGAFAGSKKQSILRSALNAFETGTGKLGEGVAATFDKDVNEKRNALQTFGAQLMSLMKTATGATASQMNSDADIKLARQAFEANDYETFKKVLPVLEKRYGLGTLTVPGPSAKERYNKMFGGQ